MASSPIVARWELSRRLAARRRELDMGVEVITKALGFTRNYWSAVENDRTLVAEDTLRQLFNVLEFDEPDRTELLELREASRQNGWWDDHSHLSRETKRFFGFEDGAYRINAYDSNIIPGLLQTDEYTRSLVSPDPANSQLEVDDLLAIRRRRQGLLRRSPPTEVKILVSEAALRQQVGGPEAQKQQLDRILKLTTEVGDALDIHVIPFTTNPGLIAQSSTMLILEFESPHLPSIVWQEAVRTLDIIESGDEQFRRLEHSWSDGLQRSLSHDDSILLITKIRAELS